MPMFYYQAHYAAFKDQPAFIAPPLGAPDNLLHLPDMTSEEVERQIIGFALKALEVATSIVLLASTYGVKEWRLKRRLLSATLVLIQAYIADGKIIPRKDLRQSIKTARDVLKAIVESEDENKKGDLARGLQVINEQMGCSDEKWR